MAEGAPIGPGGAAPAGGARAAADPGLLRRGRELFRASDALRGWLSLAVLLFHVATIAGNLRGTPPVGVYYDLRDILPEPLASVLRGAAEAFFAFFVLSAYLVSRPFLAWVAGERARPSVRRYAVARVFRLLPTWLTVLGLAWLVLPWGPGSTLRHLGEALLLQPWTFTVGDPTVRSGVTVGSAVAQGWSMHVEFVVYFLLAAAIVAVGLAARRLPDPRRRASASAAAVLAICALAWVGGWIAARESFTPIEPWMALPAFVPGVLLALAETQGRAPALVRLLGTGRRPLVLFWACVLLLVAAYLPVSRELGPTWGRVLSATADGGIVAALLLHQWSGRDPWRWFDLRALRWIGQRSLPLYLVHQAVALLLLAVVVPDAVTGGAGSVLLVCAAVVVLSVGLAVVLHRVVEEPGMRAGARLGRRLAAVRAGRRGGEGDRAAG